MKTEHAVLIIDNFDSFTHNLAALVEEASPSPCQVMRAAEGRRHIEEPWQAVIFGPGPSVPDAHPDLLACLRALPTTTPALGVCLGMQAFAEVHGGRLGLLDTPRHGKLREMTSVRPSRTFEWPECPFPVGSYHSWVVEQVPPGWNPIATDAEDLVMAMEHSEHPWAGVQFHPESVMTPTGLDLMKHFLNTAHHG